MRYHFLLVSSFALLVCSSNVYSTTTNIERSKFAAMGSPGPSSTFEHYSRLLRSTEAVDTVLNDRTEERNFWKWLKVRYWLETGKTEKQVRKALHLKRMDEATMKRQANYKYYAFFIEKTLVYRIGKWGMKDTPTWDVWKELGLANRAKFREQIESIAQTPEFKTYERYVNAFDRSIQRKLRDGIKIPSLMVSRGASDAEMYARISIMASAQRDDEVAKVLLGLTQPNRHPTLTLNGPELTGHVDFEWFKQFQILRERVVKLKANP